jgi:hypothetical protein
LALGNVDADSALEIVTSGGYVIDGATGTAQWHYTSELIAVSTGNIDASGPDEIVAWVDGQLAAFRAGVATPLFTLASQRPDTMLVADIGGDARAEILTGDNQHGDVTAYRYDAAASMANVVFQIDSQEHGVSAFGVGDVDGDSAREIVWGTGLSSSSADRLVVAGLNPGIEVEWTNTDPVQLDGPFVGGAPGGSPTEPRAPLFVTTTTDSGYSGSRIVRLDPLDGTIDISPEFDTTGSRFFTLAVDDYDADGTDEALLAGGAQYNATPTVYDFYSDDIEWTPAQFQPATQIASANVYGDTRDELVWFGYDGVVSVLDVATQQLIWESPTPSHGHTLKLADLDGNGYAEIIAANLFEIAVFERSPTPQPFQHGGAFSSEPSLSVVDVAVGDTDGDGAAEIFALLDSLNATEPHRIVQFDGRLRLQRSFFLSWEPLSIAIEQSPFARKNLLATRADGELGAGRLVTIDARNGAVVSESPQLTGGILRDSVHYLNTGSGEPRLSIGTWGGMYLTR